jgi:biotin operon repressor
MIMGYISRSERVELTVQLLGLLTEQPQSLESVATRLGKTRDNLWHIFLKLKKAKMIQVLMGPKGGIKRSPNLEYTEYSIRDLFGYNKQEQEQRVLCTFCDTVKDRIFVHSDGGKFVYVDKDNRRWKGRKCPECCYEESNKYVPDVMTSRKCRNKSCRAPLPASRYFDCYDCKPELPSVDEDYLYHGVVHTVSGEFESDTIGGMDEDS